MIADPNADQVHTEFVDSEFSLSSVPAAADSPADIALAQLFTDVVRHRPDDVAVISERRNLTFSELANLAAQVSQRLARLGVRRDDCVGVFAEPSEELMVGVWGTLLAGAAYLPLSPEYPAERLRYMIGNSGCHTIVTSTALRPSLAAVAPADIEILTVDAFVIDPTLDLVPPPVDPASLAYVIYTSGSTGQPKGVMIENRSIVHQMRWVADALGLDAGSRILQKTPFSFDAAQWEILAVVCGATVVMATPGAYREPARLLDTVREHAVTDLQCVPTLWSALVDEPALSSCTSLTGLYSGGEVLTRSLATELRSRLPQARLVNLYGPTEVTINSTFFDVTDEALALAGPSLPIGDAVADTELFILGADHRPVADGEVGELYIGGVQVARGYLNNPELTDDRFVSVFDTSGATRAAEGAAQRMYKTGDLASWSVDGKVTFVGRADNQVKINGYRIELDEVRLAVEDHHWIRKAAVVPWTAPRTGAQQLAAFIELDATEAALMDQGQHGAHHQSKQSKVQVKAQLAQGGIREAAELVGRGSFALPGATATPDQYAAAFRRKTYRTYTGEPVDPVALVHILGAALTPTPSETPVRPLDAELLGEILRWFGPFASPERLLPKYAYASPGALNATQLYVEVAGLPGIETGLHYFQPVAHELVKIAERAEHQDTPRVRLHLVGKREAIESVYATNIEEVLHLEAGHMLGLLDHVLAGHGRSFSYLPAADQLDVAELGLTSEHYGLTGVELGRESATAPAVEAFLQAHDGVSDTAPGLYAYGPDGLSRLGTEVIERKDVIAINQQVYQQAAFGVTLATPRASGWAGFVELGRALQRLETNDASIGLMSSGYSSLSERDLPSARRFESLRHDGDEPQYLTYFAVGGQVSQTQLKSTGMLEDAVHMRGPAEILRDDLHDRLPYYMVPAKVVVVDALPTTANGKCDTIALKGLADADDQSHEVVEARTAAEQQIAKIWATLLHLDEVSVEDDFFQSGGNSLTGVSLINQLNQTFGCELPVQTIFESTTVAALAHVATETQPSSVSRLVELKTGAEELRPVYCWPGLGGYPMNLRGLAKGMDTDRPFFGVQAEGINAGEEPYPVIQEMAAHDVELILERQPEGPYTLFGYSFGARVAFETAYQLEQAGRQVDKLVLIAPGSPTTEQTAAECGSLGATFANPHFVSMLFSVFAGTLDSPLLRTCLTEVENVDEFCEFIQVHLGHLTCDQVRRITNVVRATYEFKYSFAELDRRAISAPMTIIKADGDDYSFIERKQNRLGAPVIRQLAGDHYSILRGNGLPELIAEVNEEIAEQKVSTTMPHINIKHFPVDLTESDRLRLVENLTAAVTDVFGCDSGVISIALEPIAEADWGKRVYRPEIVERHELLAKAPEYDAA